MQVSAARGMQHITSAGYLVRRQEQPHLDSEYVLLPAEVRGGDGGSGAVLCAVEERRVAVHHEQCG